MNDEQDELLEIEYACPECGEAWRETWSCACDSECPRCGERDIMASRYRPVSFEKGEKT